MNSGEVSSLEEARRYIYSIDFSNIIDKLVNYQGWRKKATLEVCELYRNFLFLNKKYKETNEALPPSEEIDEFWHNHILDTQEYMKDCQAIFGHYLHHYPYLGIDGVTSMSYLNNAFERTQELHLKEFGRYIPGIRLRKLLPLRILKQVA